MIVFTRTRDFHGTPGKIIQIRDGNHLLIFIYIFKHKHQQNCQTSLGFEVKGVGWGVE